MTARSAKGDKSFIVRAKPAVLAWARKTAHLRLDEAAKGMNVTPDDVENWEAGTTSPSYKQLEAMAKTYKRPVAFFYLPEPPSGYKAISGEFRLLPGEAASPSHALATEIRRIQWQREIAISIHEQSGEPIPEIDLKITDRRDWEIAATRIRAWLGVSLRVQLKWRGTYEILNAWIAAVESKGIYVAQATGVAISEMRGCAISERPIPVVVINSADAPRAKVFTLLHELVHVLMRNDGICDHHYSSGSSQSRQDRIESFCNRVAAAIVIPRTVIQLEMSDRRWSISSLARLSRKYGLSQEAILRQFVSLGRATQDEYFAWREANRRKYSESTLESGGGNYFRNHLARLGRRYASDVVDAYRNELISGLDASDYLDMRLVNVPKLEQFIRAGE